MQLTIQAAMIIFGGCCLAGGVAWQGWAWFKSRRGSGGAIAVEGVPTKKEFAELCKAAKKQIDELDDAYAALLKTGEDQAKEIDRINSGISSVLQIAEESK